MLESSKSCRAYLERSCKLLHCLWSNHHNTIWGPKVGGIDDEAARVVSLAFPNHVVSKQIQFTYTSLIHKFVEGCDTSLCR